MVTAKFEGPFDAALRERGCTPKRLPPRSPQLNAFAERWIRSIRRECLDHFIAFRTRHLDHLVHEYLIHYLGERPHQGLANWVPSGRDPQSDPQGPVTCRARLGGVLRTTTGERLDARDRSGASTMRIGFLDTSRAVHAPNR